MMPGGAVPSQFLRALLVSMCCSIPWPLASQSQPGHPLDGLTARELDAVRTALAGSGRLEQGARIHLANLREPAKADVLGWRPGQPFRREAVAVLRQGGRTYEAIVDVAAGQVTDWREVPGAQPNLTEDEIAGGGEAVKRHPDWQAAMHRRGITNFESVICEALASGYLGSREAGGPRLGRAICYDLSTAKNFWGRPIEGLMVVINLDTFEVVRVSDTGPVAIPSAPVDYDAEAVGTPRAVPGPIAIQQPGGPGFDVDGNQVRWQKWSFHLRLDPRVGPVVSTVRYTDGDRQRSVLYQGSLSELVVPYMAVDSAWYWRTYMDAGEFLVGMSGVSLEPGSDCPDNAYYFDVALAGSQGEPLTKERAACVFERYAGDVAWRHSDFLSGETEVRRKRDLVVRFVAALGNYDYTFDWTFQQDGTIRVGVAASGMEQVMAVADRTAREAAAAAGTGSNGASAARDDAHGRFVSEHLVAINHDHFFNFRLDLDVDGPRNSFVRDALETERLDGGHPRKSIWVLKEQTARTEADAKLRIRLDHPALWRVVNPDAPGPLGYPTSYEIKAGANAVSLLVPDDFPSLRAGFTGFHLWVTPYRAEERYAAGDYPMQHAGGDGLPKWTGANRAIENTDVVVWYTLGMHHVVRAEDWPVLPSSAASFELRPFDFFSRNPAIDLPPKPQ